MKTILVYVEDPGAANFAGPLIDSLSNTGLQICFYSSEPAYSYLKNNHINTELISDDAGINVYLDKIQPDAVVVGTSENRDTAGFRFITESQKLEITTIGIVDGPANADHRFKGTTKKPLKYAPDWLLVPDKLTFNNFSSLGFDINKIFICGHPYHDLIREKKMNYYSHGKNHFRNKIFPTAGNDDFIIVFLTERSDGLDDKSCIYSSKYTLQGRQGTTQRTKIVLEEFLDAIKLFSENIYPVLRIHPKDESEEYGEYIDEFKAVSTKEDALSVIFAADLVVGLSTSLLVEAEILGLNTLSILPHDGEKDLIPTVSYGLTPCATNREQIHKLLTLLVSKDNVKKSGIDELFPAGARQRATEAINFICYK